MKLIPLRKSIYPLVFAIFCFGCNNTSTDGPFSDQDSIKKSDKETNKGDGELNEIVEQYTQMYSTPFISDSSYLLGNDTFRVSLRHACLMDSAVVIPQKYVGIYGMDSFTTHNFASSIKVEKNGVIVVEKDISKNEFDKFLDSSLKAYGVLLYPSVKSFADSIEISYSVSIPLTDVGVGVGMAIKKDGTIALNQR